MSISKSLKPSFGIDDIVWHVIIFQPQLKTCEASVILVTALSRGKTPLLWKALFDCFQVSWRQQQWENPLLKLGTKWWETTNDHHFLRDNSRSTSKRICFKILDLTWWPLPHQFPISKHHGEVSLPQNSYAILQIQVDDGAKCAN